MNEELKPQLMSDFNTKIACHAGEQGFVYLKGKKTKFLKLNVAKV